MLYLKNQYHTTPLLMPIKRSTKKGKLCYKWGDSGKCYPYTAGDKASRERAKKRAMKQGQAIEAAKARRK
jgi:hypothetical protein